MLQTPFIFHYSWSSLSKVWFMYIVILSLICYWFVIVIRIRWVLLNGIWTGFFFSPIVATFHLQLVLDSFALTRTFCLHYWSYVCSNIELVKINNSFNRTQAWNDKRHDCMHMMVILWCRWCQCHVISVWSLIFQYHRHVPFPSLI